MGKAEQNILVPADVMCMLNIHYSTLMKLCQQKKIPHFKLGSSVRFNRESIDRWMIEQTISQYGQGRPPLRTLAL